MNSAELKTQLHAMQQASLGLSENPLVQLALRRQQRQAWLLPGWKRNAWVFLLYCLALILTVLISVSIRNADSWSDTMEALSNVSFGLMVGAIAPLTVIWFLAGLFKMCRDCLGWYSQLRDSGGTQMLDSLICMSPVDNYDVILAGLRLYVAPLWPRILTMALVFCLTVLLGLQIGGGVGVSQALWFMPLSIIAMSISGVLGSICLGLYLFLIGLNLRLHLIVPLISLLIALLQVFCISFGSAFFAAISGSESLDIGLWPLALLGLAAGLGLFVFSVRLAFSHVLRPTWLLVVVPLLVPVTVSFGFLAMNLASMSSDEEPFLAFFGNLMWAYNCFMPFSPFSAPSSMLLGRDLGESLTSLAYEPWRWPLLIAMQCSLILLLSRAALIATRDRRTALD